MMFGNIQIIVLNMYLQNRNRRWVKEFPKLKFSGISFCW